MQARFSPDGKRIAYLSDAAGGDNVWVMDADGTNARQVTKEDFRLVNNPVWHPDGEYIAARKHFTGTRSLGSGEIWLYHAERRQGRSAQREAELAEGPRRAGVLARRPLPLLLAGHDTRAASSSTTRTRAARSTSIQRLDLAGRPVEPFVTGPGGAVRPVPSPDGKSLAFVRRLHGKSALFVKDLETRRGAAGLGRPRARPAGGVGDPGRLSRLRLDARQPRGRGLGAGQAVARRPSPAARRSEIPFHVKDTREVRKAVRFQTAVAPDALRRASSCAG